VILRVIRGRARPGQLEALRRALAERVGSGTGEVEGPTSLHLASRPSEPFADVLVVSFWTSAEAAAGADARGTSPLSVARQHLTEIDVALFEVDETILRRSEEKPVAIRLATGGFSKPGSDIEMLDLLRQRAPLVDDEMTEAYVGRRIVGRAVEVTFVSAWRALPTDRNLEDPFWADIALRYDRFEVAVYTPVSAPAADRDA
jgi:hypothetical protein